MKSQAALEGAPRRPKLRLAKQAEFAIDRALPYKLQKFVLSPSFRPLQCMSHIRRQLAVVNISDRWVAISIFSSNSNEALIYALE